MKIAGGKAPAGVADGVTFEGHDKVEDMGWLSLAQLGALLDRAGDLVSPARYSRSVWLRSRPASGAALRILGDLPSLREVWGDAAMFVQPGNERALVDAVVKLATDDALRAKLGRPHASVRGSTRRRGTRG